MTDFWTPVDATSRHAEAVRGYDLLGVLHATLPLVREEATVEIRQERALTVLEEFTVRAILEVEPLNSAADISDLLGLGQPGFVEPLMGRLERTGLLSRTAKGHFAPEPGLADRYARRAWVETVETHLSCFLDPLTGQRSVSVDGVVETEPREVGTPDTDGLASWATSPEGPLASTNRHEIQSVTFTNRQAGLGLPCSLIVCADASEGTWWWEPFLPGSDRIAVELRDACRAMGADDAARALVQHRSEEVPPEPPAGSAAASRVASLVESPSISVKRYGTAEAGKEIVRRIGAARREVIVSFPWIKAGALTPDLLGAFQKALAAGASVYVAFGIAQREEDEDSHPDAIRRLASLKAANTGERIHVVWVGHSHAKEVVVDRAHYLGGSFNRLSFRGDPDAQSGIVRRESMIYTNEADVVEEARSSVVTVLQERLRHAATSAPIPDAKAWWSLWNPVLKLGLAPGILNDALAGAPVSLSDRVEVLLRVIPLFQKATGADIDVDAVVGTIPPSFLASADTPGLTAKSGRALASLLKRLGAAGEPLAAALKDKLDEL